MKLAPFPAALAVCGMFVMTFGRAAPPAALREATPDDDFTVREEKVPMRDGVRLYTLIITPKDSTRKLPILLQRTPYNASAQLAAKEHPSIQGALGPHYAELPGYIWVFQDSRGRQKSEGHFIVNRPPRGPLNPTTTDETTDAYDTIGWLVKNAANNNGRVGIYGTSYPGWLVLMALLDPHPALKAAIPVNPLADGWMGDDWFHNGAFRLKYALEYLYRMETQTDESQKFPYDRYDLFGWYLKAGSLADISKRFLDQRHYYLNKILTHPAYDDYWQGLAAERFLGASKAPMIPTMYVHGWFDQEDIYGDCVSYAAARRRAPENKDIFYVAGPWFHGQCWEAGQATGAMNWGEETGRHWRENVLAPFLAHYLNDGPPHGVAPAVVFETGANRWRNFDGWPPRTGMAARRLYLAAGGKVAWTAPVETDGAGDSFVSDPAKPVPYQPRPIRRMQDPEGRTAWCEWLVADQRFADGRPDVLTYESEPLIGPVTVRGPVTARLSAETTGTDADWVVKLIDVFPDDDAANLDMSGYEFMISGNILRGRYRESFGEAKPIAPNLPLEYAIPMPPVNHTFKAGHRIMVQVQSTWFPLYDRNPQTFVPNIMTAKPTDYRAATERIDRSAGHPSYIELLVDTDPARP